MSFSLDLSRAIEKAKGKQDTVIKKVMLELFSKVVMKSPVDTGRFRANWVASIGTYSTGAIESTDKGGSSTVRKIGSELKAMTINDKTVYLVNALPYSIRLENGWSKQAPQGCVRLSLVEITSHYGA